MTCCSFIMPCRSQMIIVRCFKKLIVPRTTDHKKPATCSKLEANKQQSLCEFDEVMASMLIAINIK